MIALIYAALLGGTSLVTGLPVAEKRTVTALDQAAFEEAQQRDDTATRAFSSVPITTSDGQCLFVDELSGDFRANLTPIQVGVCDGSDGQLWDVITAGKHDDQPGTMLMVSTLTQACFNFDPRRAAGNQVLLFSCGGRADGVSGAVIDQAACNAADPNQSFTFGGAAASSAANIAAPTTTTAVESSPIASSNTAAATITLPPAASTSTATVSTSGSIISVSRAGRVLNPSAAAEANPRDDTATRAFSSVAIKSADGQCLFIDPTAGDFRENLIPIVLQPCDGSTNQQWDVITAGVHDDQANSALIVSSLTQGCLNFDPRRAAGDTVIMFSCGGRADGGGAVTNSQLFTFTTGETSLTLQPENGSGDICLVPNASGRLDQTPCSGDASQVFTIG
ncbi:hypothetical protein H2202_004010 [Exophiala xenobiotica]|nr:hypothetical protein H2202_004010 [Exophiala xenobiotica]